MKKSLLFLSAVLVACPLSGQTGAHRIGQVLVKGNGISANVVPYAAIKVCVSGTQCSTISPVYSDQSLTHVLPQPISADASGNYSYYTPAGCVDEQISAPGSAMIWQYNVCPSTGTIGTGSVNSVSVATANGFQGTVTNPTSTPVINLNVDGSHYLPTTTDESNWNGKQAALGFTPENVANKDAASGYAGLTSGTLLKTNEFPAFTGDAVSTAGTTVLTLATVNSGSGSCGDATHVCEITTNAKGLVTAQTLITLSGLSTLSVGDLSPLFTSTVTNPTTTPSVTFTQSPAPINSVFAGAPSGSAVAPTFQTSPTFSANNLTNFPTFNQNTTGTASNLSGTPALPNGTTATTQTVGDNSAKIATDAFVLANSSAGGVSSINSSTGAFTFTGAGVGCTGTTCTFSGTGSGIGSITWALPSWLAASPTTISATGTQTFSAATGQTANEFLATPNGTTGAVGLRTIVSADIPTLNQNTTGTASNLSGTPALPNGTTATTQTVGDNTTKLATDAFVLANGYTLPQATTSVLGGVKPDGTTCTTTAGVLTCPGSGGISGLTIGYVPVATSPTAIGNSLLDYGITTASIFTFGAGVAINDGTGHGGGFNGTEGTAITGASSHDALWADSTDHRFKMNNNNGGATDVVGFSDQASSSLYGVVKVDGTTITATGGVISAVGGGSGISNITVTVASGTTVGANSCGSGLTATMTGVATTSSFSFTPNADITAITGWTPTASLYISAWPTANTLNYKVCNDTANSITTGANVTFNVGAK